MRNGNIPMPRTQPQPQQNQLNVQPIKNLMSQLKLSANPSMLIQSVLAQNPQLIEIVKMAQGNEASLQQVAQMMAQQRGYDLNSIIQDLQS